MVSQRARDAVRDFMSGTTLRETDELWQDELFAPAFEDPEPVGGLRVTHFQGYLDQVDWTEPPQLRPAGKIPSAAHQDSIARARAAGREAWTSLPRTEQSAFAVPERDPIGILESQHTNRLPDLIPVRIGRMLETPFSFYRGAAAVMAHDLADSPVTGHTLIASGDAHLANFGLFASRNGA